MSCTCNSCDFSINGCQRLRCMKHPEININSDEFTCDDYQHLRVKIGSKIKFKWMNQIVEETVIKVHVNGDRESYEVAFPIKDVAHNRIQPANIIVD